LIANLLTMPSVAVFGTPLRSASFTRIAYGQDVDGVEKLLTAVTQQNRADVVRRNRILAIMPRVELVADALRLLEAIVPTARGASFLLEEHLSQLIELGLQIRGFNDNYAKKKKKKDVTNNKYKAMLTAVLGIALPASHVSARNRCCCLLSLSARSCTLLV
jgi:hypothetical protein